MNSITNIYKIGNGPSSSHTIGPFIAAQQFKKRNLESDRFEVILYGSLALTGKGHKTDQVLLSVLGEEKTNVIFDFQKTYDYHPNAMKFISYKDEQIIEEWLVYSIGGGDISDLCEVGTQPIYPHRCMQEILEFCRQNNLTLLEYIKKYDCQAYDYMEEVYNYMRKAIQKGISVDGVLEGGLNVPRRAKSFFEKYQKTKNFDALIYSYALATSEENASSQIIVTAPTCGSSGVVPAVLLSYQDSNPNVSNEDIYNALLIGGLIGNIIKYNGSISGAEVGCAGEIGAACSMAAGAMAYLLQGNNYQIEYASEIALEHHLGLTCDPIDGLVQIPCIERNALASIKAIGASKYAVLTEGDHKISLDKVINVMKSTGIDLKTPYKETAIGGLARKN